MFHLLAMVSSRCPWQRAALPSQHRRPSLCRLSCTLASRIQTISSHFHFWRNISILPRQRGFCFWGRLLRQSLKKVETTGLSGCLKFNGGCQNGRVVLQTQPYELTFMQNNETSWFVLQNVSVERYVRWGQNFCKNSITNCIVVVLQRLHRTFYTFLERDSPDLVIFNRFLRLVQADMLHQFVKASFFFRLLCFCSRAFSAALTFCGFRATGGSVDFVWNQNRSNSDQDDPDPVSITQTYR